MRPLLATALGVPLPDGILDDTSLLDDAQSVLLLLRTLLGRQILPLHWKLHGDRLAAVFHLHRNTISKVFQRLAEDGYVRRRSGRPAIVVAHKRVLPKQQTERLSHTALAAKAELRISNVAVRRKKLPLSKLRREKDVQQRLELDDPSEEVFVYSRIRELRPPGGAWLPAIAETAYFISTLSPHFYEQLEKLGADGSLHDVMTENGIEPITGKYGVRISRLPTSFRHDWARCSGLPLAAVDELRFLRFESTTYGASRGPIEYSVAFLAEGFFSLSTANLALEIRADEILSASRRGAKQGASGPRGRNSKSRRS